MNGLDFSESDFQVGATLHNLSESVTKIIDETCAKHFGAEYGPKMSGALMLGLARLLVERAEQRGANLDAFSDIAEKYLIRGEL